MCRFNGFWERINEIESVSRVRLIILIQFLMTFSDKKPSETTTQLRQRSYYTWNLLQIFILKSIQ